MGLLAGLASGIGAGMEAGGKMLLDEAKQESAFQRNMQMLQQRMGMESQQRRDDAKWKAEFDDKRQADKSARIENRAGLLAGGRAGLLSQGAGLDDAEYRGDEGVGANVQQGQQRPTTRDYLMAQAQETGNFADVYRLERDEDEREYKRGRDEKKDARDDQEFSLRKQQVLSSVENGRLSRRQADVALAALERENDPQAQSLMAEGAQFLAKGDRDAAIKSFTVAAAHYGNKKALEMLAKLGTPEKMNASDAAKVADTFAKLAEVEVDEGERARLLQLAKQVLGSRAAQIQSGSMRKSGDGNVTIGKPATFQGKQGEWHQRNGKTVFVPYK